MVLHWTRHTVCRVRIHLHLKTRWRLVPFVTSRLTLASFHCNIVFIILNRHQSKKGQSQDCPVFIESAWCKVYYFITIGRDSGVWEGRLAIFCPSSTVAAP